jgi:7-cyano-7-deazaguanine reductase
MSTKPTKNIVAVDNPKKGRDYTVQIESPEFTCLCPMTGQPDFATIKIEYIPCDYIVELKSLKLYLWSFRDEGHYHEDVTNIILDDLVATLKPKKMKVESIFQVRGGIYTSVICEH